MISTAGKYRAESGSDFSPVVGLETVPVKVDIHNGRILNSSINQDRNGFILISQSYPHANYYDGQILGKYYPECCKMVQSITGVSKGSFCI